MWFSDEVSCEASNGSEQFTDCVSLIRPINLHLRQFHEYFFDSLKTRGSYESFIHESDIWVALFFGAACSKHACTDEMISDKTEYGCTQKLNSE